MNEALHQAEEPKPLDRLRSVPPEADGIAAGNFPAIRTCGESGGGPGGTRTPNLAVMSGQL